MAVFFCYSDDMPHIHTEPGQHDHTISIYLVRTDFDEPKVMFHFHRKVRFYAQFGGHIELNETPWDAAKHELREETGYDIDQLKLLQPAQRPKKIEGAVIHPNPVVQATMGYPVNQGHFHTDVTYAFVTNEQPAHTPAEGESTDIVCLSRSEITEFKQMDGITRDTALYVLDEILPTWQLVAPTEFE
jgi:8-oxo-dGTP pyrophosphatase MutT (NUDIX family)